MKPLRLKVTNYRGINTREIKFNPLGITRIEGPNEPGMNQEPTLEVGVGTTYVWWVGGGFDVLIKAQDIADISRVGWIRPCIILAAIATILLWKCLYSAADE